MTKAAATHCDNCGCDWLDNGLNPVGCPYCKQSDDVKILVAERDALQAENERLLGALHQIAEWPDGGNLYGQEKIKRFAQHALSATARSSSHANQ